MQEYAQSYVENNLENDGDDNQYYTGSFTMDKLQQYNRNWRQ